MKILLIYPSCFYSPKWGRIEKIKSHLLYLYSFISKYYDTEILDLVKKYGTMIFYEEWWKKTYNHNILSRAIIPSYDFYKKPFFWYDKLKNLRNLNGNLLNSNAKNK